ncbi:MAG TPA: hypothetical protein VNJ12_05715 [Candidatus Dormibacteraeota bacterium]|nr:hypothetical protein [Candidatus Dormibacteraeota bacterium]
MNLRRVLVLVLLGAWIGLPCRAAAQTSGRNASGKSSEAVAPPAGASSADQALPAITYRKIFKGSTPEYVEIKVDERGAATYDIRQLDDRPNPQPFEVSAALTAKIFSLAAALHDFSGVQLNVRRLIANLGEKTFRYEGGGRTGEVSFNYTVNPKANQLMGIFEGLSLEDQYIDQLRRSMRYDPLGVNDVLMRLESDLESNAIAEPQVLVPVLKKIASSPQLLDIARDRARQILVALGQAR